MICVLLLFLTPFVLTPAYFLFQRLFLVSVRTVTDVIAILRPVDERELDDLLNTTKEEILRANSSAVRFQEGQRVRARLLFEYLRRMAFDALVILSWAHAEQEKLEGPGMPEDATKARAIREVTEAGTGFRLYALIAFAKLIWRLFLDRLKIRRVRKIADLRHANEIDGLEQYRRLVSGAVALGAAHGDDAPEQLLGLLRGNDSIR
jgi:hypothetical protein